VLHTKENLSMKIIFFKIILLFIYALETNVLADEVKVKKIFEGLDIPTHLTKNEFIASNSIFVLQHKLGQIIEIKNYGEQPTLNSKPILNIESLIPKNEHWEQGLNGFAFSPYFENDKYIFVSYVNKKNRIILSRFQYEEELKQAPVSSEVVLLNIERGETIDGDFEHNCGTISFNPKDKYLYFCTGDTRSPEGSQDINVLSGKILRINPFNPGEKDKNYSIVKDNPFIELGGKPEILFSGLRNPWKFSIDAKTGDIYIPDVGSEYIEELNIVEYKNFNKKINFGWSCFEGSYRIYDKHYSDVSKSKKICLENINNPLIEMVEPKLQYFHDSLIRADENIYGNSITGGVVYKNEKSIWNNHYFFGDFISGNVWYLDTNKKENYVGINLFFEEGLNLTSINQIDDKLLATSVTGIIYEIVLPKKKNLEKSIYSRPIVYSKLHAVNVMNRGDKIIFTSGSGFYKFLSKMRRLKEKFFGK